MVTADLIREARLRAGLSQVELGRRLGKPQSTIARWETGAATPSLEAVRIAVRACGLELTFGIANYDDSYLSHIDRYLNLAPAERLSSAVQRARVFGGIRDAVETARRG
jgi:transcriptional regulator with XRE-family HTH domain